MPSTCWHKSQSGLVSHPSNQASSLDFTLFSSYTHIMMPKMFPVYVDFEVGEKINGGQFMKKSYNLGS